MKKILITLLLIFMGCSVPKMVMVNMPEDQFKKEHSSASVVEVSEYRTVYKQVNIKATGNYNFYYFKNGKLALMDEGFYPRGSTVAVPTPEH